MTPEGGCHAKPPDPGPGDRDLLVDFPAGAITAQEVLDQICTALKLVWWIHGGTVHIAPVRPWDPLVTKRIPVGHLKTIAHPDTGKEFAFEGHLAANIIRDRIDIEVWEYGGRILTKNHGKVLLVIAPASTQRKIIAQLRKLTR